MSDTPNDEKHAGGRPLTFQSVEELDKAIQDYFDMQDPHVIKYQAEAGVKQNGETIWETRTKYSDQKPYTMSGLARALGVSRRTLLNYKNRDEFLPSIQGAIDRCEEYTESQLYGPYANGAKFSLTNNFNGESKAWAEKQVLAGDPDAPLATGNPLVELSADQLRKLAEAQPDGADSDTSDSV